MFNNARWRQGLQPEDIEHDGQPFRLANVLGEGANRSHRRINYTTIFTVAFLILAFIGACFHWW